MTLRHIRFLSRMPVYIRKGPADIPEPPDSGHGDDEEELFLSDPAQLQDQLPQPFRMIDKVLDRLVDRAWDFISQRETVRVTEQAIKTIPVMQVSGDVKVLTHIFSHLSSFSLINFCYVIDMMKLDA